MAGAVFDPADCGCAADLGVTAKDPMSAMPGMHHAMMMADMPHEQAMSHPAVSPAPQSTHTMPLDHAEACGYCCWLTYRGCSLRWRCLSPLSCAACACFSLSGAQAPAFLPGCTRNPRAAASVCFLLSKITMRTALRSLCFQKGKV